MTPFYDQIAIDRDVGGAVRTETFMIGVVGGVVGGLVAAGSPRPAPPPVNSRFEVRWNGNTLVFELGTYTGESWQPHDWTERRETWALQPNGELGVDIATSSSADRPRTVSATYRRRE